MTYTLQTERQPESSYALIYIPEWDTFARADYYHWVGLAYFHIRSAVRVPSPDDRLALVTGSILNWFPAYSADSLEGVIITTPPFIHGETVKEYQGK